MSDFDMTSAVPIDTHSDNKSIIHTETDAPTFDINNAKPAEDARPESSPIGRAIRGFMKNTPWEKWQTYNYVINKYKDSKGNWSDPKFQDQVKKDAADYEEQKAAQDPWQQVAVPMTVGAGLWVAKEFATKTPIGAAVAIGGAVAGGYAADKLLPLKEWFNKVDPNPSPWVRDTVSIIDGLKNMGGMAAGAKTVESKAAKTLLGKILNIGGAKPNVDLTPEHIEDLQAHLSINERERADAFKTMGIEDNHIKSAASTNSAISVPADRMMDLAKKPYYSKIRDVFSRPEEPQTSEVKANLNVLQKGVEQGKQWGMAVGKGVNYVNRLWYNLFNSYMPVRQKFGGATEDPVYRAILMREGGILGLRNQKSEILDKTFRQLTADFQNKYSKEVLDNLMLVRGKGNSEEAIKIQLEALEKLPKELQEDFMQRAITENSDYTRNTIIKAGVGIDYHDDYIRGAYKWPRPKDLEDYIGEKGYKSTDSFKKAKIYPTYADIRAKYPAVRLREPNPFKSMETEMRSGLNRAGMKRLKNQIMSEISGEPEKITNATVRVGNAYSDGIHHEDALNKLGLSKDELQEGSQFEALFRTNWDRLLTRNEAKAEFNVETSEDIPNQVIREPSVHMGYAVMAENANRDQKFGWENINDKEFDDMLFHPTYAKFLNNLLSTNKIREEGLTGGLANTAKFFQILKFSLSGFHFKNVSKGALANEAYGIFDPRGWGKIKEGFKGLDRNDPEYKEYVSNIAGTHEYSIESDAQRALTNALNDWSKVLPESFKKKLSGIYSATKFVPASPEFINWMFDEYIPKIKFESWKSEVAYQEGRLGRRLQDWEKRDIARVQQNFYGEMNEKLFGRSGTVTSALRIMFTAPGYGEGNFRALGGSMAELRDTAGAAFGVTKIPKMGYKNTQYITTSLVNAMILGIVGTRIFTGRWPSVPKNGNDIRDLFKTHTNFIDGNGDAIDFDNLDYANDFYSIYGNVLTGRIGMIPKTFGQRVTGAESVPFQMLVDLAMIANGRQINDYRNLPVFQKTDDFAEKVSKYMAYRALTSLPISMSVFERYRQSGVPLGMSIAASVSGTRQTSDEPVKISKDIREDIFDLKQGKEVIQSNFNKLYAENPQEALKQVDKFNNQQLKKATKLMDNLDKLGISQEDLQGTPKEVRDLFNSSLESFLIKSVTNKKTGDKEQVELTDKQEELLNKMSNVEQ